MPYQSPGHGDISKSEARLVLEPCLDCNVAPNEVPSALQHSTSKRFRAPAFVRRLQRNTACFPIRRNSCYCGSVAATFICTSGCRAFWFAPFFGRLPQIATLNVIKVLPTILNGLQ